MITVDYLLANEDRHQNNFGVIRNAETLEYLGPAPLYDNGSSLWFDKPTAMIGGGRVVCKPFKNSMRSRSSWSPLLTGWICPDWTGSRRRGWS